MDRRTEFWKQYSKDELRLNLPDTLSWEAILLFQDEIDEAMLPKKIRTNYPDPLLIHSSVFEDDLGDEWVFSFVTRDFIPDTWLHGIVIRNGKLYEHFRMKNNQKVE